MGSGNQRGEADVQRVGDADHLGPGEQTPVAVLGDGDWDEVLLRRAARHGGMGPRRSVSCKANGMCCICWVPNPLPHLQVLHEKEDEEEEGGRWVLRLVKMPDDDLEMEFLCAYEFRAWKAHIETAILRAERKPDYTAIVGIENTLSNLISRSLLPLFEPEQIIEKNHLAVLSGCVVCSQGSTWWGSHDWKRRWVVLHQNFMCIRPDKAFPQRNLVIPLREVKCWSNPIHNHPNTLEVTGPFIGSKMFCFDDEEGCNKWKMAITSAIFASNPEDATTDKIHQTATDKRGIV